MASGLTIRGKEIMLLGNGSTGSIARVATKLLLYGSNSSPVTTTTQYAAAAAAGAFSELATANGYTTGGLTVAVIDWAYTTSSGVSRITLADRVWSASGAINNIAGCFLVSAATPATDNIVLAWWERTPFSVVNGDAIVASGLYIEF